jgi:hypothetical protein
MPPRRPDMAKQLDDWRRAQVDLPGRPEAHPPACRSGAEGEGEMTSV